MVISNYDTTSANSNRLDDEVNAALLHIAANRKYQVLHPTLRSNAITILAGMADDEKVDEVMRILLTSREEKLYNTALNYFENRACSLANLLAEKAQAHGAEKAQAHGDDEEKELDKHIANSRRAIKALSDQLTKFSRAKGYGISALVSERLDNVLNLLLISWAPEQYKNMAAWELINQIKDGGRKVSMKTNLGKALNADTISNDPLNGKPAKGTLDEYARLRLNEEWEKIAKSKNDLEKNCAQTRAACFERILDSNLLLRGSSSSAIAAEALRPCLEPMTDKVAQRQLLRGASEGENIAPQKRWVPRLGRKHEEPAKIKRVPVEHDAEGSEMRHSRYVEGRRDNAEQQTGRVD